MTEPGTGTLSADLQVLVDAWTGVAVDLYGQLVAAGGRLDHSNLVVSPSSVATVLAMILPGARTATADEIAATLHTRLEPERVAAAAGALDRALLELARADELDLRISNGRTSATTRRAPGGRSISSSPSRRRARSPSCSTPGRSDRTSRWS